MANRWQLFLLEIPALVGFGAPDGIRHLGRRHIPLLAAPTQAHIVDQIGHVFMAELIGKAGHGLHALAMGQITLGQAFADHAHQVQRRGKHGRGVGVEAQRGMRLALAIDAMAACAQTEVDMKWILTIK